MSMAACVDQSKGENCRLCSIHQLLSWNLNVEEMLVPVLHNCQTYRLNQHRRLEHKTFTVDRAGRYLSDYAAAEWFYISMKWHSEGWVVGEPAHLRNHHILRLGPKAPLNLSIIDTVQLGWQRAWIIQIRILVFIFIVVHNSLTSPWSSISLQV